MAKQEEDGSLTPLVADYAYAEDGQLIWNALLKFAKSYLSIYYDDNTDGKKVCSSLKPMITAH